MNIEQGYAIFDVKNIEFFNSLMWQFVDVINIMFSCNVM